MESTELALAFQLSNGSEGDLKVQPRQQPVFAFLPLRSFGFRFIVQGLTSLPYSFTQIISTAVYCSVETMKLLLGIGAIVFPSGTADKCSPYSLETVSSNPDDATAVRGQVSKTAKLAILSGWQN